MERSSEPKHSNRGLSHYKRQNLAKTRYGLETRSMSAEKGTRPIA
jgi:hypothetical protein